MKSLSNIADILYSRDYFYILTHKYPDGDTLGSAYALCRALQNSGKKAKVLYSDEMPNKYDFMLDYVVHEEFTPQCIISVDIADTKQLGDSLVKYSDNVDICIDHHITNKSYAEITFVNAAASSTAEIIYFFIKEMNVKIDKEMAECIYVGISTDTGCFKYSNVTAQTHRIVADLIELGMSLNKINKSLFDTKSKALLKLQGMLFSSIEYFFGNRCAMIFLTNDIIETAQVEEQDLEGIASIPRCIDGVEIGITLREKEKDVWKVSVRTTEDVSAVGICEKFNGGGHLCAAGFTIEGDMSTVKSRILLCLKDRLKR